MKRIYIALATLPLLVGCISNRRLKPYDAFGNLDPLAKGYLEDQERKRIALSPYAKGLDPIQYYLEMKRQDILRGKGFISLTPGFSCNDYRVESRPSSRPLEVILKKD